MNHYLSDTEQYFYAHLAEFFSKENQKKAQECRKLNIKQIVEAESKPNRRVYSTFRELDNVDLARTLVVCVVSSMAIIDTMRYIYRRQTRVFLCFKGWSHVKEREISAQQFDAGLRDMAKDTKKLGPWFNYENGENSVLHMARLFCFFKNLKNGFDLASGHQDFGRVLIVISSANFRTIIGGMNKLKLDYGYDFFLCS